MDETSSPPSDATSILFGGLVGYNMVGGQISNSTAAVTVTAPLPLSTSAPMSVAGGLVGRNDGTITGASASGQVSDQSSSELTNLTNSSEDVLDGLVGLNDTGGTITTSSASGDVSSNPSYQTYDSNDVASTTTIDPSLWATGGLVGENRGSVSASSYVAGQEATSGGGGFDFINEVSGFVAGGLVGRKSGSITQSYALPFVGGDYAVITGPTAAQAIVVGGFVGINTSQVSQASAVANDTVSAGGGNLPETVGGFVGENLAGGSIQQAYTASAS